MNKVLSEFLWTAHCQNFIKKLLELSISTAEVLRMYQTICAMRQSYIP